MKKIDGSHASVKDLVETSKCGGSTVAIHMLIANTMTVNVGRANEARRSH